MDPALETSLSLIERVRAGDAYALDALIARYRPRLVRWASGRLPARTRDLTETQDVVQQTLFQAFSKIGTIEIRAEGALQAYLRQALLNAIRAEIRRAGRRPVTAELLSDVETVDPSPLEQAIGAETLQRYDEALAALRPDQRELIIANVEFEFTHQELAAAFDKPSANAARMALQRALVCLADEMNRRQRT
jgi:RNA polymerase sigma factor (sigma-70 family)